MKNYLMILLLFTSTLAIAQRVPDKNWMQFERVEEAGFSAMKLDSVKKMYNQSGGSTLLVIYDGAVVLSIGDPSRKFMDHSMRKSYLSALFGIHAATGEIDLNETLEELDIDDVQVLSDEEKKATVADLLSAKSGVYHPSAYSPRGMAERMPARGSHEHGTFWYYNNWDFNTLSTIFKQKTNQDLFEAFNSELAKPLGLEDFELDDTFYRTEDISEHPAYLFRLSARDEARFGLLYANKGRWNGRQVIPEKWIEQSTSEITTELTNFEGREGYGYLWWTTTVGGNGGYYASGVGGQRIAVFPDRKMVIVQSTNTYKGPGGLNEKQMDQLITLILDAQTEKAKRRPDLVQFQVEQYQYPNYPIDSNLAKEYVREYNHRFYGAMSIQNENDQWVLKTTVGEYRLHPKSETQFIPEDIHIPMILEKATNEEDKGKIVSQMSQNRTVINLRFLY